MNYQENCCDHIKVPCDTLELSNLQRCGGFTMHGCGNPLYNVHVWDRCHAPEFHYECEHSVPASWLCSYLLKSDAAKIYATNKSVFDLTNLISDTYVSVESFDAITDKLETETNDRISANTAINLALTNEVTRAISSETNIQSSITNLSTKVDSDLVHSADYNSSTKNIEFKNTNGTIIDTIDASVFIKDGMIDTVRIDEGNLKIVFNTDAGKSDILIPISSFINASDYYTKTDTNALLNQKQDIISDLSTIRSGAALGATALQSHQDISGKADKATTLAGYNITNAYTKSEADSKFLTQHQSLDDYYTKSESDNKYLTTHQSLADYYTKSQVDSAIQSASIGGEVDLSDYYTKSESDNKYLTSHQSLDSYYTKDEVDSAIDNAALGGTVDLNNYYTKNESDNKYLTTHQSLSNYYTKTQIDEMIPSQWFGTQSQYDDISTKDNNTVYFIHE